MKILKKWFNNYRVNKDREKIINNLPIDLLVSLYSTGLTGLGTELDILKEICFFLVHDSNFTKDIEDYLSMMNVEINIRDIFIGPRTAKQVELINGSNNRVFFEETILC